MNRESFFIMVGYNDLNDQFSGLDIDNEENTAFFFERKLKLRRISMSYVWWADF